MEDFLAGESQLSQFIAGFEDGTWPAARFHHAHHLAVAACYLAETPDPMDKLRAAIRGYNLSQGGENTEDRGYHETITRFWMELVSCYIRSLPAGLPRLDVARLVVSRFAASQDYFREFYDFDVIGSREARANWIPPTRPLVP